MCVLLAYDAPVDSLIVKLSTAFSNNDVLEVHILFHELIEHAYKNNYASGNIWHNYLTHFILSNSNPFSLACERREPPSGSLRDIAMHDFEVFYRLFHIENEHMHYVNNFTGSVNVNSTVCEISKAIAEAKTASRVFDLVANFYKRHGVGRPSLNYAFRFDEDIDDFIAIPNENIGNIRLDDIIGYEIQKQELAANTEAFVSGRPANNVLLYGDGGTGKSTSIKAILNEYSHRGLRVIEVFRHQFRNILRITETLRQRNYYFIIFIDDLSFEEHESEYKYLKAVIEGGIETKPSNVLIYATSNRRHIVREIWKDRDDMEHNGDIHRSDTVEEKLSLASRFGIAINYSAPSRRQYHDIVLALAKNAGLDVNDENEGEFLKKADAWEIRHGGMSGRAARQYIDYLLGRN
ncbi:MAG: ATP-binding protein [Synergistaceae bacterium]|nr:ATP-binding protein [Synergistaceae bacterium]